MKDRRKTFELPFVAKSAAIICRSDVELEYGTYAFKIDLGEVHSPEAAKEQTGLVWSSTLNSLYQYSKQSEPSKWVQQVVFTVPPGTDRIIVEAVQWKNKQKKLPKLQFELTAAGFWDAPNIVTIFGEMQND